MEMPDERKPKTILDFQYFSVETYSKLQTRPDLRALISYLKYVDQHSSENINWSSVIDQLSWIKQYNLVFQEHSPGELTIPLLLWLQTSDEWKSNYCIDLRGEISTQYPLLATLLKSKTIDIVEIEVSNEVHNWWLWKDVLKAEIIHSYRLNFGLKTKFDPRRLISIWSRIFKEFQLNQYILEQGELSDDFYDRFRIEMLEECLNQPPDFNTVETILESYVMINELPNWHLIETFVEWLDPKHNNAFKDFLISWEILHNNQTAENEPELDNLRKELSEMYDSSELLSLPLIALILEHKICQVWREILEKRFPEVAQESWYPGIVASEQASKEKLEKFVKLRGTTSIYCQDDEESLDLDQIRFETILPYKSAFVNALLVTVNNPNFEREKRNPYKKLLLKVKKWWK